MQVLTDRLTVQSNPLVRESKSRQGHQRVTVCEFASGEVVMYVDDDRCFIQEEIALSRYIEAYEIYFDAHHGWMAGGREIPYLDIY